MGRRPSRLSYEVEYTRGHPFASGPSMTIDEEVEMATRGIGARAAEFQRVAGRRRNYLETAEMAYRIAVNTAEDGAAKRRRAEVIFPNSCTKWGSPTGPLG